MKVTKVAVLLALLIALAAFLRGTERRLRLREGRNVPPITTPQSLPVSMEVPSHVESQPVRLDSKVGTEAARRSAQTPGTFVPNQGQLDPRVKFLLRDRNVSMFFTPRGWTLAAASEEMGIAIQAEFVGGREAEPHGVRPSEARVNYYVGSAENWRAGLPTYGQVVYPEVWPGIDVIFEPRPHGVEYSFLVKPGGRVESVRLAYRGADRDGLGDSGERILETPLGRLTESKPRTYQEGREISSLFQPNADGTWGFDVGHYDATRPLVIDPVLSWSTFLGGGGWDVGFGIAVDDFGNVYVAGLTWSADFPTVEAYRSTKAGDIDVFVTKIRADGQSLIWSTYLGGNRKDEGWGLAIDSQGSVYVTGLTDSSDFPTTTGAYEEIYQGNRDAFVAKLRTTGGLHWSTYLGGEGAEEGTAIAVDLAGGVYAGGVTSSTNFPATLGAFQPALAGVVDCFVTKVAWDGASLAWSTYLGGSDRDHLFGVAVDASGTSYVTGETFSANFPTTSGAHSAILKGFSDAFVTVVSAGGGTLGWSTYLGGTDGADIEEGRGIAVDYGGNVYVAGLTPSSDFPTTTGALSEVYRGGTGDGFITKFNADGWILWSTYLGGSTYDWCWDLAVDPSLGIVFVTGATSSPDFPTIGDAYQATKAGSEDAFVTVVEPGGGSALWSTYFGGSGNDDAWNIAIDPLGVVYVTGVTWSGDFPVTAMAYDTVYADAGDAFIARFEP